MAARKKAKHTSRSTAKAPAKRTAPRQSSSKAGQAAAREDAQQRNQVAAVILFAVSLLLGCLVLIPGDHVWLWLHSVLLGLFGSCAILWPILLMYIAFATATEKKHKNTRFRIGMIAFILFLFCSAIYIFNAQPSEQSYWTLLGELYQKGTQRSGAGLIGGLLGIPLASALGGIGSKIVIVLLLFVAVMLLTGTGLIQLFQTMTKPVNKAAGSINSARKRRVQEKNRNRDIDIDLDREDQQRRAAEKKREQETERAQKLENLEQAIRMPEPVLREKIDIFRDDEPAEKSAPPQAEPEQDPQENAAAEAMAAYLRKMDEARKKESAAPAPVQAAPAPAGDPEKPSEEPVYRFPPLSMLEEDHPVEESGVTRELQSNGQKLVDTLKSFGVQAKIVDISRGPAVTRYELQPAAGVKISKITNLSDDIAMNLAASGVRIEAPIPGKAAIGIEIPNRTVSVVRMRGLIESSAFTTSKSRLTVALGRDIAGSATMADLAKMPHLLIAGSTGSGKSVCINSLIISLLYKSTPDEVKFLMVDPKVVELGIYNGIPHLLVPVVTDPRKAAGALSWAVSEMLNRYKLFAENNVRDLAGYNRLTEDPERVDAEGQPLSRLPQIVIIIDELADLMMAAPNEVEDSICRLAQMARAAGMHLVIATQRPSVDVITGIIKANIPSRIAFAVSSQVDSRTILDMGGAEKLLGRGDMLFAPVGSQKPVRVQGCFVSDSEIESIVNFVKESSAAGYDQGVMDEIERNAVSDSKKESREEKGDSVDPMMMDAIKCVVEEGQASVSLLQRRLRLGYARAGRLIDEMAEMGIVSERDGSKPRKVLLTYQQYLEMSMNRAEE